MNQYMKAAIEEAEHGIHAGEGGPFGCVIVKDGTIVGKGHNEVVKRKDPTCHGEIMAIHEACRSLDTFDLSGCELYTTGEPCPMCMGAALNARVDKIFFGAKEQKGRSLTGELAAANLLNHTAEVTGGVLEEECSEILSRFFYDLRARLKAEKNAPADTENCAAKDE